MNRIFRKAAALLTAAVIAVSAAAVPVSADDSRQKLPDNEAMTFVDSMGAGWNLGNAFDATNCTWLSNELDYESAWCGAKTTKDLIKLVKSSGFGTIRIPVTWHDHIDSSLNISSAWMKRVKEVVDWSVSAGLTVILDVHHDVVKGCYYPSKAELASSKKFMKKIWTQICTTFADYGNEVIFEVINEPRLTGTDMEWWYNTSNVPDAAKESLECINTLNQTALDTIRAAGGKNADRYVLVGGYDTDATVKGVLSSYFELPKDTVKNRLIVAAHYYGIGVASSPKIIDGLYDAFSSKGIPVVLTEYGLNSEGYKYVDNETVAATRMGDLVAYARNRGISVILWDNNYGDRGQGGHKFLDRASAKVTTPEIVKAVTKAGAPALSSGKTSTTASTTTATTTSATSTNSTGAAFKVTAKSTVTGKATLSWAKVSGATKYAVYQYKDGKYKALTTSLTKTSVTIKGLTSGTQYKFLVRAYVNGKWTAATTKEIVKITAK